jgi:hypothetical protein
MKEKDDGLHQAILRALYLYFLYLSLPKLLEICIWFGN